MKRSPARRLAGGSPRRTGGPGASPAPPASGWWKPERSLISVDLPLPSCPRSAWTSAGPTSKSTPSRARWPTNVFERLRTCSTSGSAHSPELLELVLEARGANVGATLELGDVVLGDQQLR